MNAYVLIAKPTALTMAEWRNVLTRYYTALNRYVDHHQPSARLHYRLSLDNTAVILQAEFDDGDITLDKVASITKNVLGSKYTLTQIKNGLTNNIKVMSWAEVTAYLAANRAEWETENV
jgi:hypothetical protein